jgi:hypothetical protein
MKQRTKRDRYVADLSRRSFLGHATALVAWPGSLAGSHRHTAASPCDDCMWCTSRFCRFRVTDLARQEQR